MLYNHNRDKGITPAYAGNTNQLLGAGQGLRDHPRLRGEHFGTLRRSEVCAGSPPPTRGTQGKYCTCKRYIRITPAYAGNTPPESPNICNIEDHPRLRGEHFVYYSLYPLRVGSPPPTRGTLEHRPQGDPYFGITPAYAGNTWRCSKRTCSDEDHPRLRGEHLR